MDFDTKILKPTGKNIALAAAEIKNGGLVAFATETVYGLGADAFNTGAVKKIFAAKGRPSDNPLIVHFARLSDIESAGYLTPAAAAAAAAFMPGPLTIVIKKKSVVPDAVTCGLDTVAVRIPSSPLALDFIKECGTPIAAPSANASGRPSPTTARHVLDDMGGKIRYILDGGAAGVGVESTIIDFSVSPPRLLRAGGIALDRLEKVTGKIEAYDFKGEKPLSPGMKYRHYAPRARVMVFESLCGLKKECAAAALNGLKTLVLGINLNGDAETVHFDNAELKDFKNADEYAAELYAQLRFADEIGCGLVLCLLTDGQGLGGAVNNRLTKAAAEETRS